MPIVNIEVLTKVIVAEESKNLVKMILENEYDLLVVSGKREHKLVDVFDIPIREKVIQLAKCPVLIINEKIEGFSYYEYDVSHPISSRHF